MSFSLNWYASSKYNCTAVHCTALPFTALHCTALNCTSMHCAELHYNALNCTALYCTLLWSTKLDQIVWVVGDPLGWNSTIRQNPTNCYSYGAVHIWCQPSWGGGVRGHPILDCFLWTRGGARVRQFLFFPDKGVRGVRYFLILSHM